MAADRVGIGWRADLAAGILLNLDQIDTLEVLADSLHSAHNDERDALRALARQIPLSLHGVSMGLASSHPVAIARVDAMARLVDRIEPISWSEHLAFVRAGGVEIGHMAAPPRSAATIESAIANVRTASRIIGARPLLENIATLIDPPGSTLAEGEWTRAIVATTDAPLLLDLHNLYANALNFGADPIALLDSMPLDRVQAVHLSGGEWIRAPGGAMRLLDDHLHDPPDPVYALLEALAARVRQPLDVVIERDGGYPAIEVLLEQITRARVALADGRASATRWAGSFRTEAHLNDARLEKERLENACRRNARWQNAA